jgi:3-dehydroquinate synthase
MSTITFDCDLGGGVKYPIFVGDVLSKIDEYVGQIYEGNKVIIVIDEVIDLKYGDIIYPRLNQKYDLKKHVIKGGKDSKTMSSVLKIFNVLEDENFSRDSLMIGIGGGVIGDMAGFASSCWYRGMKLIHIPTTLLSAVDSCVGGKTAINLNHTVNAIGSYHHPVAILIDTNIIRALPEREISSGMGEVIKYAVIHSEVICDALEIKDYQEVVSEVDWFVIESLKNKEYFVRGDINEGHKRLYLNFGHTLGHAIEFATILDGEETLRHGEAVALGMLSIFRISVELGYIDEDNITWLKGILIKFNLPTNYSACNLNVDRESLIDMCMALVVKDKKRKFDGLRLVALTEIRVPVIHETNDMELLRLGFKEVISD